MQDGNEGSHDTTVTETLPSEKILEKVGVRIPNPSHAEEKGDF